MPTPLDVLEYLLDLEYPEPEANNPDNILTAAAIAAFQAHAAFDDTHRDRWWIINDIAALLPINPLLGEESRNYQRGLAAGLALGSFPTS